MTIEKYVDNITSQHRDKPKFISWLTKSLNLIDQTYHATKSIDTNFDLDYAIGKQLDMLGTIIGRERTLTFQPMHGHNPVLDDETYRLVLKAKVAINMWNGTVSHMYEIWDNIFKDIGLEIEDNQDMSLNAYVTGYVNQIRQELIQRGFIVPKPQGVRINYIGKSLIDSKQFVGMKVVSSSFQEIQMSYDPKEFITFNNYPYMVVQGINKSQIEMKGVD